MGRKRKKTDQWMPPRVYRGKSAFEWHPPTGGAIRLCRFNVSNSVVWKRFEQEVNKYESSGGSYCQLSTEYKDSPQFKLLAPRTQKDYERYAKKTEKVFGKMQAQTIKPEHVRKYMDIRGSDAPVQANRELSYMSTVCAWGYERGKINFNPCKGVKKFKETPRDRYITDEEYLTTLKYAPLQLKIIMEISYLCAARISDVLQLQKAQLKETGIYIRQGKTGKKQIKKWNPRLESVLELTKELSDIDSTYIIHREKIADKYSYSMIYDLWVEAKNLAGKELNITPDFTFHDLKAKGISDYEGNKQEFSGYKTPAQTEIYNRKVSLVEALDLPNIHDTKKDK